MTSDNLSKIPLPFPWKLYQLLEDAEKNGAQSIVSWQANGEAFAIYKPQEFTSNIICSYFSFSTYLSFTKELDRYGFKKMVVHSSDGEIFFHPRFPRRDKNLCLALRRKPTTRKKTILSSPKTNAAHSQNITKLGISDDPSVDDIKTQDLGVPMKKISFESALHNFDPFEPRRIEEMILPLSNKFES